MSTTRGNERDPPRRKRTLRATYGQIAAAIAIVAVSMAAAAPAAAAQESAWHYAPAEAPPPPPSVKKEAPYPVPLGVVGEISFWAPNRGLLITGGTQEQSGGPVPAGIYAWDGQTWHQLSTVCGSAEGRIVWAGPDEFWTISDQRAGQRLSSSNTGQSAAPAVSLCHFVGANVVGSYAVPLQEANSWQHMTGGECYSPTNCWFGGGDGGFPHVGAFHLHWDGSTVTAVYEPEDHMIVGMAAFDSSIYESVQIGASDVRLEGESNDPAVIHTIAPEGEDPFSNLNIISSTTGKLLPEYGREIKPEALDGFDIATNAPAGSSATQLWAAANAVSAPPNNSKPTTFTLLHDSLGGDEEEWAQLAPNEGSQLTGTILEGSHTMGEWGLGGAIAPEPGSERIWLSLQEDSGRGALVEQLEASKCTAAKGGSEPCAKVIATDHPLEEAEDVGPLGDAGPIACPAVHDCWMATYAEAQGKQSGWLMHLSDGEPEEPDTDGLFDGADGVITYRPPDSGVPGNYTEEFGEDNSLENQQRIKAPEPEKKPVPKPKPRKAKKLVKDVRSKLLHHRTLVINFTLTAKAHVQLVARRRATIVAKTHRETLRPGRHSLSITLDPQHWPTKLKFEAKPVGGSAGGSSGASSEGMSGEGGGPEESGLGNVVGT
jgi:hypothetical protein